MKKYILILLTSFSLLFFTNCDDSFLSVIPEDDISLEEFLSSPEKAQQLLNAAYKQMTSGSFGGGQMWFLSDLMSDNINGANNVLTNGDWRAHYTWTTDIFLGTTRSLLSEGGKVVGRCNYLIDHIDVVPGLSDAEKTRMIAEARFLRGLVHFELVRYFGQTYGYASDNSQLGVSYHETYTTESKARNTVAEVYDKVIADLTIAANDLPNDNSGYADSWAAKAYLAKVYFQMNDYQNAYALADEVLNGAPVSFDDHILGRFAPEGSTESVFQLNSAFIAELDENGDTTSVFAQNHGGTIQSYYRINPDGTASAYISNTAFAAATANPADLRVENWFGETASGLTTLHKFLSDEAIIQIVLAHVTELKLIRAESAAELGSNKAVAIADLNDIKMRAGVETMLSTSGDALIIQEARKERRIELIGEGNRLHELKRIGAATRNSLTKLTEIVKVRSIADWDCWGLICQIPDSELQGGSSIEANPADDCQ